MLFYEGCEAGHYVSHSCLLGTYNPRNGLELQEPSFYMGVGLSGRTCPMLYNDGIRSPLDTEDYSEATIEDVYGYLARARKVKRAYNAIKDILSVY